MRAPWVRGSERDFTLHLGGRQLTWPKLNLHPAVFATGGNSPNHARAKATPSSAGWFELGVTFSRIRLGVALRRLVLRPFFGPMMMMVNL